jgi:hypothetical protein
MEITSGGGMKMRYIVMILLIAGIFIIYGCGGAGTGGAPGSGGSEDTNIIIRHVSIVGNDVSPEDIDVANHLCPNGEIEPVNALHREDATITIDATLVNSQFEEAFPASVEECLITYLKSNDNPASPIIESWTVFPNCILEDSDTNNCVVNLIDIPRKTLFWDQILSAIFDPDLPSRYIARYKCQYMNNFREEGHFQVEYEIFLTDFDTC